MAVDRYSHSSRAIDMDGRGSTDHCRQTHFPEVCVAPLWALFNCVDNYIMLVLYICHPKGKCYELFFWPKMTAILHHWFQRVLFYHSCL